MKKSLPYIAVFTLSIWVVTFCNAQSRTVYSDDFMTVMKCEKCLVPESSYILSLKREVIYQEDMECIEKIQGVEVVYSKSPGKYSIVLKLGAAFNRDSIFRKITKELK